MDHILRSKLFSHYHRQCAKEEPILLPPRIEQFYTPIEPEPPLRGSEKPVNETTGQDAEGSLRGHSTTHHHRCSGDYYCYGSGSGRTERGLRGAASTVDPLSDSASDYNGLVAQMQTATRVNAMHDATTTDGSDDDDVHEGRGSGVYDASYMRSRAVGSGAAMSAWRVVDDPLAFPREDSRNASVPYQVTMNDNGNNSNSSSTGTTTMALPQTLRCDEGGLATNTSYNAHQGDTTTTTTTMSYNNGSGSAGEVNGLTTTMTTTTEEEDEGRRRAIGGSGNDGNTTGQCTITRHVIRRRPTRPQGELLSLCDQTPEARAALRRRRKEQLRAQLNHPEAPVIVQLAERDKRLCTVGTTLTDYVNSVVDLRTQRVQKGLTDLTQVGSVVYAALPTPYSPSESHNNNTTTTTTSNSTSKPGKSEGEKRKTHKAGGKGKEAAVAAAEQHVRYNGLYAKYPGSRKGKKADKQQQQQQMLLLSRQLPLYDAASPVTFEELREHPLLLTQPRRQARWAGVVHGRVPSEEMYGQPVPYTNSDDPSQVNNTTNNKNMMMAPQQSQQQQQQSYYNYQEYGYYYYHGAQMDKARRASASLIVQQGQAMGSSCGFQGNAAPSLPSFYTMSEAGMSLTRQNTSSTTTTTTNTAAMMMMMMSSGTNNNTSRSNINVMPSQGMTLVPNTGKLPYTTTTTDYNNNTINSSSSMPMYVGTVCTARPETIGRPIATLAQPPVQAANNNATTTTSNDGWQPVMSQGSNPACPCSWSGLTLSNPSLSTPSPPYQQQQQQQQQRVEGMTTMGYTVWPPQYNDTNPSPAQRPSFTPEGYAVYLSA